MELVRPVRPWEFMDAVGQRAAIFGNEAGVLEAWVYPTKIFREFRLRFHLKDRILDAADCARELIVHPEGPSIVYATAGFTVRETLVVPPDKPGAIIRLDIDTSTPLQIEAEFVRDFQLMWPAAFGDAYIEWDEHTSVFKLSHEHQVYTAILGSPQTVAHTLEFFSNSRSSNLSSLSLQQVENGQTTQFIVVAGSARGPEEARREFDHLTADPEGAATSAHNYYSDYLNKTVSLHLPDAEMTAAYNWSRVSLIQGLVNDPPLGQGLIAGYRTAGDGSRPGFSWFFGRDSLWTDLALDSIGDFATARTALDFLGKFQRADGKIEHEIPQTAALVSWFKDYKYAYAAADSTALYILAMSDYVNASGDARFLDQHWDNLFRAYSFLHSTYDSQGLPRNIGVGHGWIEGGPLFPAKTEIYQSGLAAASLHAFAGLAAIARKPELEQQLEREYEAQKRTVNDLFWSKDQHTLVFALNEKDQRIELPTVLSMAPMWFDVFDPTKINDTIDHLAAADHASDWGMRILSNRNPLFDPTGYHFGSVWPLFTGWASVGEYRAHRPLPAYANLRANSQLTFDGALGHITEVLSGSYYEALPTSSPHQMWSSAMMALPLLRGLLGISSSETDNRLVVAPHVPADWNDWSASRVPACGGTADLVYRRGPQDVTLEVQWHAVAPSQSQPVTCVVVFSPAASLHATIGKGVAVTETPSDKHPTVSVRLNPGRNIMRIPVTGDFGLVVPSPLPGAGSTSGNLRVVKEEWSKDRNHLRVEIQGLPGKAYLLRAYGDRVLSVDGGNVSPSEAGAQEIRVSFARGSTKAFVDQVLLLHFSKN